MVEEARRSDLGTGLSVLFGFIAVLAAVATAASAYLVALEGGEQLQLLSGIGLSVAIVAGGIAIAAIHIYG